MARLPHPDNLRIGYVYTCTYNSIVDKPHEITGKLMKIDSAHRVLWLYLLPEGKTDTVPIPYADCLSIRMAVVK